MIQRRDFIALVGCAGAAWPVWPLAANGQQHEMPVIGFLGSTTSQGYAPLVASIRQGLAGTGYVEGRNLKVEYRWADDQYNRLPTLAAELVSRNVRVIVTTGGARPVSAAKAATTTIPIVFAVGSDPVQTGLVKALNRPGGNITGVTFYHNALAPKRLELIHELLPEARIVGMLLNPNSPNSETDVKDMQTAAQAIGLRFNPVYAAGEAELEAAFAKIVQQRVEALLVNKDAVLGGHRAKIVSLAERSKVPTIYASRFFMNTDGLMSYGMNTDSLLRQAGIY